MRPASIVVAILLLANVGFAAEFELNGHRFTTPDGFVVELIANSPLVDRPVSADFDELGRLYVTDSSGSNEPVEVQRKKRPHRIVRLVDTNGDGRFDESTVFADKLMFPEGSLWHDGSLYVAAPPEIWKFTDTDDDGVADKREVWFDGKTLTHCANDLHGPYLGPDGWFYWCKGAFAEQTLARRGLPPIKSKAAHIFRRRPGGGPVEYVMTGGMDNPVEIVFTPGGERIFTTTFLVHPNQGLRDGLIHAVYGGVYGKDHGVLSNHPRTGELMPALSHLGAAAPCGLARLESDGLGDGYRDRVLACSFNLHKVITHDLSRKHGATFHAATSDLLASDNLDFHPTDVLEDADGSVIVIDTGGWFRLCCPTSQLEKPDVLGGVYRVRRLNAKVANDPRGLAIHWEQQNAAQLTELLSDERFMVRRRAAHLISKRRDAVKPLLRVIEDSSDAHHRLQAVWALTRLDSKVARESVRLALRREKDPTVQQAALHSISLHRHKPSAADVAVHIADGPAHVRRAAAEALGRIGSSEDVAKLLAATATARLPDGSVDRFLEHSLIYAAMELNDAAAVRALIAGENATTRRAALIALDQMEGGDLKAADIEPLLLSENATLNAAAWWIIDRHPEWSESAVAALRKQLANPPTPKAGLKRLRSRLARFSGSATVQTMMADALGSTKEPALKSTVLGAMIDSRKKPLPVRWLAPLLEHLNGEPNTVRSVLTVLNQSGKGKLNEATIQRLGDIAADSNRNQENRLRSLLLVPPKQRRFNGDALEFVCSQLSVEAELTNRSLAVDAVSSTPLNVEMLKRVARQLPSTSSMELRPLLEVFAKSKDMEVGSALVASLQKSPAATSLLPDKLQTLVASYGPKVAAEARPLLARIEAENRSKVDRVESVLALMPSADTRRGLKVFQSTQASCIACHRRGYIGGDIGPDLNRIGKIRSERDLLESILFPSLTFVRSFEPTLIQTDDGRVVSGLVRRETATHLTLQIDAKRSVDVAKSSIEDQKMGTVSIMPDGLEKQLTPQQLADLVKYLRQD